MIQSRVECDVVKSHRIDRTLRVLVVDDESGMRRTIARVLKASGYDVETASNGEHGISLAKTFQPHFVLIDVRMPGIGGVEAYRQLKQIVPESFTIFMSAFFTDEVVGEVHAIGPVELLSKPLDIEKLLDLIRSTS
ncbi:response regulator [Thalassoglobus polymorphus]|uniref:Sporulation initiation phosphotransferase F n=1 Tax=Thalassoglobus polymorphus TaxID=2527994 RepID=A0A517QJM1_9PLAN|nr:response regulator [Thalassoglobus polymorphus]QDT31843.1 Sporulation initiation phosphotransferase F [Thalassoglobus polymorphus]